MCRLTAQRIWLCVSLALCELGAFSAACAAEVPTPDASPQGETETITVTAQRIEENAHDVPISLTVLDDTAIEYSGVQAFGDVANLVPNLWVVDWGLRQDSYFYIRGVGTSRSIDGAVGVYVDDVPYLHYATFDIQLDDIERIEVLRGPQGTLYGRNTLGGVINVVTKSSFEPETVIRTSIGDHDFQQFAFHHRGPLRKATLGLGLSLSFGSREGYTKNTARGNETIDDREAFAGRLKLDWLLTDQLEINASVYTENNRDGALPQTDINQVRTDPFKTSHDFAGMQDRNMWQRA